MKKLAIAGASLALAAMPVFGVFADVTTTTTDTLTLTIPNGCSIATAANGGTDRSDTVATFGSVAPTQTATDSTSPIVITCNASGWTLTPTISSGLTNGTATIASGATALNGTVSEWAVKLTPSASTNIDSNDFSGYAAVDGTNDVVGSAAVSSLSIAPEYKVSVAAGQATGTYNGTVLYTVAAP